MKNIKLLIILLTSILITAISLFFKADDTIIYNNVSGIVRGFPVHFIEYSNFNNIVFKFGLFLIDYLFYLLFVFSTIGLYFEKNINKSARLLSALVLAFLMLVMSNYGEGQCSRGFPFTFENLCGGSNIIDIYLIIKIIIDYIFWFIISCISVFLIIMAEKRKLVRYICVPVFITLISIFYETLCGGFMCIFAGNGFPLPYYNDSFIYPLFIIDIIFNLVIYLIIRWGVLKYCKLAKIEDIKDNKTK